MSTDRDLDALFAVARRNPVLPEDALVTRVLADAAACQSQSQSQSLRPQQTENSAAALQPPRPQPGHWRERLGAAYAWVFGERRPADRFWAGGALAGMGSAMVLGLAIGLLQPAPVAALTTAFFDDQGVSVDLTPSYDTLLDEVSADD